mgnify:CR=1 FL=1
MKELTIKELTPYLPYKILVKYLDCLEDNKYIKAYLTGLSHYEGVETTYKRKHKGISGDIIGWEGYNNIQVLNFKPILRSFDTLTAEELKEIFPHYHNHGMHYLREEVYMGLVDVIAYNNLLKKHVDVFNLINFGLALEK